ncbi:hypothetical protein EXIGLDRAFT_843331 [Exidia glandulosa HHB12029]|uniref:lytic cellulose monooxygenase (C4-dehydrogenating) n=1 Tax=Exidia glandulosa HHB12029 TaxID=1314781 RepID=A0A165CQT5_EXIGL|nr:hypothetical protein EXIGLDRAFT_843331 [Exidia glandulosa HHB12029]
MKSTTFSTLVLSIMTAAGTAFGHGTVDVFKADGVSYPGPLSMDVTVASGYTPPGNSATRQIATLEPLLSTQNILDSTDMTCGPSPSSSAMTIAPITAGSNMTFHFRSGSPPKLWPHNTGPILTYMYRCPTNTSADKCIPGPNEKGWFKIDQQGMDKKGIWAQAAMMQNKSISVPVPFNIPNGDYLVRHEVIALQNAVNQGGAEFYVSCTQVRVKGGSADDSALSAADKVAFPGAYKTDSPGIYVPDLDNGPLHYDTFPGPAVFAAGAPQSNTPSPTETQPNEPTSTPSTGAPLSSASSDGASPTRCTRTSVSLPATPASTPSATQSTAPNQCARKVSKRALRLRRRMLQGRFNPRPLRT